MKKNNKPHLLQLPHMETPQGVMAALYCLISGDFLFYYRTKDDPNSPWVSKFLTMPDVAAAWTQVEWETGWVPNGIMRKGRCPLGNFYVYYKPPLRIKLTLTDDLAGVWDIPIPATVLVGVGDSHYLWALKGKEFHPNANVCAAPFPNIYDDGRICWGANTAPDVNEHVAEETWKLFFQTPFNNHLVGNKCKPYPEDVRQLLVGLAKQKARVFPINSLKETWKTPDKEVSELCFPTINGG